MKKIILLPLILLSFSSLSAIQCGGFRLTGDGMTKINGDTVTSQHVTYLGEKGDDAQMKMDMTLMPASDGNNYGFEYIHLPDSETRFLNVQLLQANMDIPPIIASFPCKKISGWPYTIRQN